MENLGHRIAVIGGGYAGMAAAATLASAGARVTVFEAGTVVGGRARRIEARGRELDNGQHILLGAYSELLRLMRLVGVPSEVVLRIPLELRYADGFAFRSWWLGPPFGLLGGLLAARGIPMSERLGAVRFMHRLRLSRFRVDPQLAVSRLLTALLFEVSPADPAALLGAAGILIVVAMISAYGPARSATRVDPVAALRADQ